MILLCYSARRGRAVPDGGTEAGTVSAPTSLPCPPLPHATPLPSGARRKYLARFGGGGGSGGGGPGGRHPSWAAAAGYSGPPPPPPGLVSGPGLAALHASDEHQSRRGSSYTPRRRRTRLVRASDCLCPSSPLRALNHFPVPTVPQITAR